MKWCVVASAYLLAAGIAPALAADLPARPAPAYEPHIVVPIYNWNGFYIGVNGGYSRGSANTTFTTLDPVVGGATPNGTGFSDRPSGGVFGGQFGYNWHTNGLLFGTEFDFQGTSQSDTVTCSGTCTPAAAIGAKMPWFGTARARFGWAPDRWMAYFTIGGALASMQWTANQAGIYGSSSSTARAGWTVGGGFEYGLTDNVSAKIEYLYLDFREVSRNLLAANGSTFNLDGLWYDNVVRAGLNIRFTPAPVVVRY